MKDNIKLFAGISAKSFMKWLLIFIPGLILSMICAVWGFILLFKGAPSSTGPAHTGGVGAVLYLFVLGISNPIVSIMTLLSFFAFPILYYSLASKKAMTYAVSSLWQQKLQGWFNDKILNYLSKLEQKNGSLVKKADNFATVKIKLLHAIKEDSVTNKFQKNILGFIVKKIDDNAVLSDQDGDAKFSDLLLLKLNETMNAVTTPKNTLFFAAVGVQLLLLILAIKFNSFG